MGLRGQRENDSPNWGEGTGAGGKGRAGHHHNKLVTMIWSLSRARMTLIRMKATENQPLGRQIAVVPPNSTLSSCRRSSTTSHCQACLGIRIRRQRTRLRHCSALPVPSLPEPRQGGPGLTPEPQTPAPPVHGDTANASAKEGQREHRKKSIWVFFK